MGATEPKVLASIAASGEDLSNPLHKRLLIGLAADGGLLARDIMGGEWEPIEGAADVANDESAIRTIGWLYSAREWDLRWETAENWNVETILCRIFGRD